ncbi:hypothetical protein HMPREF1545_00186 [Oscillibacter sp. KLE 1728]|nr:hypothetical protein HMPREF1545_00186 [Oscillibacter sp. KLE 1728]ERK68226.1 hypothetical protein HMPREF1546_00181 [Oscillibacter sp. KLE 1745]
MTTANSRASSFLPVFIFLAPSSVIFAGKQSSLFPQSGNKTVYTVLEDAGLLHPYHTS